MVATSSPFHAQPGLHGLAGERERQAAGEAEQDDDEGGGAPQPGAARRCGVRKAPGDYPGARSGRPVWAARLVIALAVDRLRQRQQALPGQFADDGVAAGRLAVARASTQ